MSHSTTKSRPASHRAGSPNRLAHEMNGLSRQTKTTVSRTAKVATGKIEALRDRIQEGTKGAIVQVKRAAVVVKAQAAKADKKIRAKPYHSMGIAAGAGLIAGYLISRRRSKAS